LAVGGIFSLRLWVDHYLKSDAFTAQVNAAASGALEADCRIESISWQGSSAYAGTFEATGRESAAFRRLTLSDLRADLDTSAFWDRTWRVNQVKIAQVTADFSESGQPSGAEPPAKSDPPAAPAAPGWLQHWLPTRAVIGPVNVDRFDFVKAASADVPAMDGRGFTLELKPNLKPPSMEVTGRSGEIRVGGTSRPLKLSRLHGTVRPDSAALDQVEGTLEDASLNAEGTVSFHVPGDLRLKLRLNGASLERWLPEDWLKKCSGMASTTATLQGDWRQPQTLRAEGDFQIRDALLQALPMLDIIAKKTQNASFLRMQIKEATGQFERRKADDWQVRRLRADAPGLLRLKGKVDVGPGGALQGALLLGIVPGTLRYLAGAEQTVFVSADRFSAQPGQGGALSGDDTGLLWCAFTLTGTLEAPVEDLSDRLALAWFNATVEQVENLSMEAAATAARTGVNAANTVLEAAPPLLEKAPDLLNQGVQGGLKIIDGLLPR